LYISALRNWRKDVITVWERDDKLGRHIVEYPTPYDFYYKITEDDRERGIVPTNKSLFKDDLVYVECADSEEFEQSKEYLTNIGRELFESDIAPEVKILSRHYYEKPSPKLNITFLDIEVDYDEKIGFSSPKNPYAPINAISLQHYWCKKSIVLAVPPPEWDGHYDETLDDIADIILFNNEEELLIRFLQEIEDSDVLSGWNSENFDIPYIIARITEVLGRQCTKLMCFPEANREPTARDVEIFKGVINTVYQLHGRVHLDYLELFKKYEGGDRPSYKLEAISEEILPEMSKLHYDGTLAQLYRNDFSHFLRYNCRDGEVLSGFEDKLGYVALANDMAHMSTTMFKDIFGTLKLSDYAFMNYCHYVADNLILPDYKERDEGGITGAYVLVPQMGMHEMVGSVDINSLYPSAIRSINISPETYIAQFVNCQEDWDVLYECVYHEEKRDKRLTLYYDNGTEETLTAWEWRAKLVERKWAVSGWGTVYTQEYEGILPTILGEWFATRKQYQRQAAEHHKQAKAILKKYESESESKDTH
jgi:DNA polymerase elongation subunit (family B)